MSREEIEIVRRSGYQEVEIDAQGNSKIDRIMWIVTPILVILAGIFLFASQ